MKKIQVENKKRKMRIIMPVKPTTLFLTYSYVSQQLCIFLHISKDLKNSDFRRLRLLFHSSDNITLKRRKLKGASTTFIVYLTNCMSDRMITSLLEFGTLHQNVYLYTSLSSRAILSSSVFSSPGKVPGTSEISKNG